MSDVALIPTWDLLLTLGFTVAGHKRLIYDFGNFKLTAGDLINLRMQPVIYFTGVMCTSRTIVEVDFQLPRQIKSLELCVALIVYYLDKAASNGIFSPTRDVAWLTEGRKNKNLLPWNIDQATYMARPRCTVQRNWLRVALKTLQDWISSENKDAILEISFDGSGLSFKCGRKTIVLPGEGQLWVNYYTIPLCKLMNLPKRLMGENIEISINNSILNIGQWTSEGVTEVPSRSV